MSQIKLTLSIISIIISRRIEGGGEKKERVRIKMQFHRYVVSSMSVCKGGEPGWWKKNWAENDAREIDRRSVTRAKNNWLLTHQLTSGVTGGSLLFRKHTETGGQWWSTRYTEIDTLFREKKGWRNYIRCRASFKNLSNHLIVWINREYF